MRIGRICRLRSSLHLKNPAMRFGVLAAAAGLVLAAHALAQGPPGAAAAATGAATAATAAAPAPKKTTVSADIAAAKGSDAAARIATNNAVTPVSTEEAANGAVPAGGPVSPAVTTPAPPLTGVAAQCASLLKLATSLKSEVDKTTKDVLSMTVVREASQIEETAKKMRQEQH